MTWNSSEEKHIEEIQWTILSTLEGNLKLKHAYDRKYYYLFSPKCLRGCCALNFSWSHIPSQELRFWLKQCQCNVKQLLIFQRDGSGKSLPSRCHLNFIERHKESVLCKTEVLRGAACHTQYSYFIRCFIVTANFTNSKERGSREPYLLGKWQENRAFHFCFSKLVMNNGHSCLVAFIKCAGSIGFTPYKSKSLLEISEPLNNNFSSIDKTKWNLKRMKWSVILTKHFHQNRQEQQKLSCLWNVRLQYAPCWHLFKQKY